MVESMTLQRATADRRRLEAMRRWATLLDSAFGVPGTRIRFGIDALVGLVPGLGDAFTGLFSVGLLVQAARMGVPRIVLARMAVNVLIDLAVGTVPILGDLFDVGWKANLRNVALLERFVLEGARRPSAGDYLFIGALALVLLVAALVPVLLLALLLNALGRSWM